MPAIDSYTRYIVSTTRCNCLHLPQFLRHSAVYSSLVEVYCLLQSLPLLIIFCAKLHTLKSGNESIPLHRDRPMSKTQIHHDAKDLQPCRFNRHSHTCTILLSINVHCNRLGISMYHSEI